MSVSRDQDQEATRWSEVGHISRTQACRGCDSAMSCRLTYYSANTDIGEHRHDEAHISVLLAGRAQEKTRLKEMHLEPFQMASKPPDLRHANRFGPDGALFVSIACETTALDFEWRGILEGRQRRCGTELRREWGALANLIASGRNLSDRELEDRTACIFALLKSTSPACPRRHPPAWLSRARDAVLESDTSVRLISADAGVHRVHLARLFREYFGETITECRRRQRLSRAVGLMLSENAALARTSCEAGFCDQPHLTRAMKREFGVTPNVLRCALAD